jgi:hypothetical protein
MGGGSARSNFNHMEFLACSLSSPTKQDAVEIGIGGYCGAQRLLVALLRSLATSAFARLLGTSGHQEGYSGPVDYEYDLAGAP